MVGVLILVINRIELDQVVRRTAAVYQVIDSRSAGIRQVNKTDPGGILSRRDVVSRNVVIIAAISAVDNHYRIRTGVIAYAVEQGDRIAVRPGIDIAHPAVSLDFHLILAGTGIHRCLTGYGAGDIQVIIVTAGIKGQVFKVLIIYPAGHAKPGNLAV